MFVGDNLDKYRQAVDDEHAGETLGGLIHDLTGKGYTVNGAMYKNVPRGFAKDHPRGDLLKYKGMYIGGQPISLDIVTSADLVDHCYQMAADYAPLIAWQVKAFE